MMVLMEFKKELVYQNAYQLNFEKRSIGFYVGNEYFILQLTGDGGKNAIELGVIFSSVPVRCHKYPLLPFCLLEDAEIESGFSICIFE